MDLGSRLRIAVALSLIGVGLHGCGGPREDAAKTAEENDLENADASVAASAANPAANGADVYEPLGPTSTPLFKAALELEQTGPKIEPSLRRGDPVPLDSTDWPASFITAFETADGPSSCTAAMIGPGVMLTAAHCVPENGSISFTLRATRYPMTCTRHPQWESGEDPSADFALCRLAGSGAQFSLPPGTQYETVDLTPMDSLVGRRVILTGYGCTSDEVRKSRIDGRYRIGGNSVIESSNARSPSYAPNYYAATGGQRDNLFTSEEGANLCPGDSGGPAFIPTGTAGTDGRTRRRIIGVNSRVFYAENDRTRYGASLISSTGTPHFRNWAVKWVSDNAVRACGLANPPQNCRI